MAPKFLHRTMPIIQEAGLKMLQEPLVAISGLGGVGGGAFLSLVRCGVKRFRIAENGIFDEPDMNRQAGAFSSTIGKPKIDVYRDLAQQINPDVELECFPEGINLGNIEKFLKGSQVYVGVIDVEKGQDVKDITPEYLKRFNIPLFTSGVMGFGAVMVNHAPDGMMPDEFWKIVTGKSRGQGILPSLIADKFSPLVVERINDARQQGIIATTSIGGNLAGTILAAEVLAYLLKDTGFVPRPIAFAPRVTVVDLLMQTLEVFDVTTV